MKAEILKMGGAKTEEEFYKMYPTEASFRKKFGNVLPKAQTGIGGIPPGVDMSFLDMPYIQEMVMNQMQGLTDMPNVDPNADVFPGTIQEFFRGNAPLGTRINPDYRAADTFGYNQTMEDAVNNTNVNKPNTYKGKVPGYPTTMRHASSKTNDVGSYAAQVMPTVPEYNKDYSKYDTFGKAFKAARKELGPGATFIWTNPKTKKTSTYGTNLEGEKVDPTALKYGLDAGMNAMDNPSAMDPGMAYHYGAIAGQMPLNNMQNKLSNAARTMGEMAGYKGLIAMDDLANRREQPMAAHQQYQYGGSGAPTAAQFYNPGYWPIGPSAFYRDGGGETD